MSVRVGTPSRWVSASNARRTALRRFEAIVMPFGTTTYAVKSHPHGERFTPQAFENLAADQPFAPCTITHLGPVAGGVVEWRNGIDGLHVVVQLNNTSTGRRAAELIDSGEARFSIGFRSVQEHRDDKGVRIVTGCEVDHVAVVGAGTGQRAAYSGTGVIHT